MAARARTRKTTTRRGGEGVLPVFPLQTVLLPGGLLPLRVFEPRYKKMVAHCLETGDPFVVALIEKGLEVAGDAEPFRVGCAADLLNLDYRGSQIHLTALGRRRMAIDEMLREGEFPRARVREMPGFDAPGPATDALYDLVRDRYAYYTALLARTIRLATKLPGMWQADDPLGPVGTSDPVEGAWVIAEGLSVHPKAKQRFLEAQDLDVLLAALQAAMDAEIGRLEALGRRYN